MDKTAEALIGSEFVERLIQIFDLSKRTIEVVVFDWRWYPTEPAGDVGRFNAAIGRAAARGVKVRAIVNNDDIANRLREIGVEVRRLTTKKLVHVKLIVVDEKTAVLGSHNFTSQAFAMNLEASVVLDGEKYPPRLREFFENLWAS